MAHIFQLNWSIFVVLVRAFQLRKGGFHPCSWIRIYSLPWEFWLAEIIEGIENTLGIFIKIVDATRQGCYTSYVRIYVYMNIEKPLPHPYVWITMTMIGSK
jgi:hypothetical protein